MISLKAGVGAWPLRLAKRQRGGERNGAAMAPAFKLALLAGRVDEFKRPERPLRAYKAPALQVELCFPRLIASRAEARQRLIRAFGRGSGRRASSPSPRGSWTDGRR
jgi:hypothetical protein